MCQGGWEIAVEAVREDPPIRVGVGYQSDLIRLSDKKFPITLTTNRPRIRGVNVLVLQRVQHRKGRSDDSKILACP